MHFAINVLHFLLGAKDAFIRDLQAVPGNMSAIKCGHVCHHDMKCLSYFHDQNFMKCYPYFRVLPSRTKELQERNGINYYVKMINNDGKWCTSRGHEYIDAGSICYSKSQTKASREKAGKECHKRRGWLFVVDSEEEHMFFLNVVQRELKGDSCFIGGWRHQSHLLGDTWKWNSTRIISKLEFRWHIDEPIKAWSGSKNCIQYLRKHGKYLWGNVDCEIPNNYYCHYLQI